jgi:hypothetical protein
MNPQDCNGFWSVLKANPPVHIASCAGGFNAAGALKNRQDVDLFSAVALNTSQSGC